MVAQICSSVQLPFIYLNLSAILVPSERFSCRSQVSYHTLIFYFTTRTRAIRMAKRKLPSRLRQVLSIAIRRTRYPISMTFFLRQSSLDLQLQGCTTAKAHPVRQILAC